MATRWRESALGDRAIRDHGMTMAGNGDRGGSELQLPPDLLLPENTKAAMFSGLSTVGNRISAERSSRMVRSTQDRCADRKDETRRIVVRGRQDMMDQPAMDAAVPADMGVNVDKSKGQGSRGNIVTPFRAFRAA